MTTSICGDIIPDSEFVNKVPETAIAVSRSGDTATVTARLVDEDADQKINVIEVSDFFSGDATSWSGHTLTVKLLPEGIDWTPNAVTVTTRIMKPQGFKLLFWYPKFADEYVVWDSIVNNVDQIFETKEAAEAYITGFGLSSAGMVDDNYQMPTVWGGDFVSCVKTRTDEDLDLSDLLEELEDSICLNEVTLDGYDEPNEYCAWRLVNHPHGQSVYTAFLAHIVETGLSKTAYICQDREIGYSDSCSDQESISFAGDTIVLGGYYNYEFAYQGTVTSKILIVDSHQGAIVEEDQSVFVNLLRDPFEFRDVWTLRFVKTYMGGGPIDESYYTVTGENYGLVTDASPLSINFHWKPAWDTQYAFWLNIVDCMRGYWNIGDTIIFSTYGYNRTEETYSKSVSDKQLLGSAFYLTPDQSMSTPLDYVAGGGYVVDWSFSAVGPSLGPSLETVKYVSGISPAIETATKIHSANVFPYNYPYDTDLQHFKVFRTPVCGKMSGGWGVVVEQAAITKTSVNPVLWAGCQVYYFDMGEVVEGGYRFDIDDRKLIGMTALLSNFSHALDRAFNFSGDELAGGLAVEMFV